MKINQAYILSTDGVAELPRRFPTRFALASGGSIGYNSHDPSLAISEAMRMMQKEPSRQSIPTFLYQ
jgi:hypothetical protein